MSNPDYTLYLYDISYFSGKMEGYLRYKQIPYRRVEPSWREIAGTIHRHTGLMKLPVIERADGVWMQDSTPMIAWFERQHPNYPVVPRDRALAFVHRLIEDYADEWMWRPALYYRWAFEIDAKLYSERFVREFLYDWPLPSWLVKRIARARQKRTYLQGDGVDAHTREAIEALYHRTLAALDGLLERGPFLAGEAPSVADFGFFASMFRHFSLDPTPSRIMRERAPRVYEWVARMWAARGSDHTSGTAHAIVEADGLDGAWGPILDDISQEYMPYLVANWRAGKEDRERFDVTLRGVPYKALPVVPYRVWCLAELQRGYEALGERDRGRVSEMLAGRARIVEVLAGERVHTRYNEGHVVPEREPLHSLSPTVWLRGALWGTSWRSVARRGE